MQHTAEIGECPVCKRRVYVDYHPRSSGMESERARVRCGDGTPPSVAGEPFGHSSCFPAPRLDFQQVMAAVQAWCVWNAAQQRAQPPEPSADELAKMRLNLCIRLMNIRADMINSRVTALAGGVDGRQKQKGGT